MLRRSALSSVRGSADLAAGPIIFDKKPGPISNRALIDLALDAEGLTLKADLIEHHDYEAVLPRVWDLLVSWYDLGGGDQEQPILRPIRYNSAKQRYFVDLYLLSN